jgi:hypothetical protein
MTDRRASAVDVRMLKTYGVITAGRTAAGDVA